MLADQHIHSSCSDDADDTMLDMAIASAAWGVTDVCFTDHCDLEDPETAVESESCFDYWPKALEQFREAKEKAPVRVRIGVEIGAANHCPERARQVAATEGLDLVMGSIHNLRGLPDFYYLKYESEAHCLQLLDRYADELVEYAALDCFDVMSHIGYTRRYMQRAGFDIAFGLDRFGDRIETALKILIQNGRGIELNCSSPKLDPEPTPTPVMEVLRLYRQLGGEIITVGSDGHRISMAGKRIRWGHEVLKEAGFRYAALFEKRKPVFYEL